MTRIVDVRNAVAKLDRFWAEQFESADLVQHNIIPALIPQ
jgi:hypothetical protein